MIRLNNYVIKTDNFPAGETRIELSQDVLNSIEENNKHQIIWNYDNDSEMLYVHFLVEKLRDMYPEDGVYLHLPYFPHARMDRTKEKYQINSLKYFCSWLKSLHFDEIVTESLHSDVAFGHLSNLTNYNSMNELIWKFYQNHSDKIGDHTDQNTWYVFPDETAFRRFKESVKPFSQNLIVCNKTRDFNTGKIISSELTFPLNQPPEEPKQKINIIMVDDICSYGGTFKLTLDKLVEYFGCEIIGSSYLLVPHLEESVFNGEFIKHPKLTGILHNNTLGWSRNKPSFISAKRGELNICTSL